MVTSGGCCGSWGAVRGVNGTIIVINVAVCWIKTMGFPGRELRVSVVQHGRAGLSSLLELVFGVSEHR